MGGKNETIIGGLRAHVSGTDVHVHDDQKKLKYAQVSSTFKKDMKQALEDLKNTEGGVILEALPGYRNLSVFHAGNEYGLSVMSDSITELNGFLKGL